MKKLLIGILGICLLIGIPFITMDFIASGSGPFNIPAGYEKIKINLGEKARTNEVILTKELEDAAEVSLMLQSDSNLGCTISLSSDKKMLGNSAEKEDYYVRNMTGQSYVSPKLLLQPGKYTITITNVKTNGTVIIGYKETKLSTSEYARLLKIDGGDLNNPSEGYELLYSSDLSGLDYDDEIVDTITLDRSQEVGICVYTNSSKGSVSVDFIGESNNFLGLVSPKVHYICDKMEGNFAAGNYKIQLTCKNADGQIYIFIKK